MLEYFKMILQKVSFDVTLFRTELEKATHSLLPEDITELKKWCIETFGVQYCQKAVPEFIR
ncbi:MAG: hypothetical protein H7Y00_06130 [Fimbriimonadaceae bacterium]|nr:hypothetical protein [Chitinophagales bacterium]